MRPPYIVGIAGVSASGKTTLAKSIRDVGRNFVQIIEHDWYYLDRSAVPLEERDKLDFENIEALDNELLCKQILDLKAGIAVNCPQYDFLTQSRKEGFQEVCPAPFIIVEGVMVFLHPILRSLFDLRVYVEADLDACLGRRIGRDSTERGRSIKSILDRYFRNVKPLQDEFVIPSRKYADVVMINDTEGSALRRLNSLFSSLLLSE